LRKVRTFAALGRDARFAAGHVGKLRGAPDVRTVSRKGLDKLLRQCCDHTPEELAKRYGMRFADAETLNPAMMVYQALLQATRARRITVSPVSMLDGLLLDLARSVTGQEDVALNKGIILSAMTIAEKYRVDVEHARKVAELSLRLFDELLADHGLGARERLLLHVAALTHEVGGFVSSRAHHKHSYYLIANSEFFGLTRDEVMIVAQVGRYHRRSVPRSSHVEYMALPREKRMVVSKLAALMRVADALDRAHAQQVRDFRCERQEEEWVIMIAGVADLALERRAIASKGDLFEDTFGMRVRLEEAELSTEEDRRGISG